MQIKQVIYIKYMQFMHIQIFNKFQKLEKKDLVILNNDCLLKLIIHLMYDSR